MGRDATMSPDGVLEWRDAEGRLHRPRGPARVFPSGREEYYRRGKLHREDGPAVVHANDGNGALDGGETVLKDRAIATSVTPSAAGNRIVFQPNGFPVVDATNGLTRVLMCDDRGSVISTGGISAARGVTISATGRPSVTREKSRIEAAVTSGGFGGCL